MKRMAILSLTLACLCAAVAAKDRSPLAQSAEQTFFRALNQDASLRKTSLRELTIAAASDPTDGRTNVLLGLCHLWVASDGSRSNPEDIDHLILAEHYLARAQELNPADRRIPSWLVPARLALAAIERRSSERAKVYESLREAFHENPGFHSFSVGLIQFGEPRNSENFRAGLEAVRIGLACKPDNPACTNYPRWPHNIEAFNLFAAHYEMKGGNVDRARAALETARTTPGFASWRHAQDVEDRLANVEDYTKRYANDDPSDDPPAPQTRCSACHAN